VLLQFARCIRFKLLFSVPTILHAMPHMLCTCLTRQSSPCLSSQDPSIEHIRRQMALLQQQTKMSAEQVKQQLAWLRQQMHGLVAQVRAQVQEEQDAWELDALQVGLQCWQCDYYKESKQLLCQALAPLAIL